MNNSATLKKILRDYNYLYESLIDVKDISSIAESEFREAMVNSGDHEAMKALTPDDVKQTKLNELKESEVDKIELTHNDVDFKKLFRKIVVQCHPDKTKDATETEAEFLKQHYENATKANDTYDWGLLIRVASKLDIPLEGINIQINEIKKKNEELQNEINKYENSLAFQWYNKDTKEQKQNFLEFCLGVFKQSNKS